MGTAIIIMSIVLGFVSALAGFAMWQWQAWRKAALSGQGPSPQDREDKDQQYKDSYEALVNSLDEERRQQQVAMTEAFDFINDNGPFGSHDEGLKQVRNVLLYAIQNSSYGRG